MADQMDGDAFAVAFCCCCVCSERK